MEINGVKVKDANKSLRLNITKNDVKLGATKDAASCAAARALCRLPEVEQARVHLGRTYLKMGEQWVRFQTPDALRSEIIAFDRGGQFAPGEYTLMKIQPSQRASVRRANKRPENRNGTRPQKRIKPHVVEGVRDRGANR